MEDKEYDSRRYGVLDSSLNKRYVTHTLIKLKTITTNMVKKCKFYIVEGTFGRNLLISLLKEPITGNYLGSLQQKIQ